MHQSTHPKPKHVFDRRLISVALSATIALSISALGDQGCAQGTRPKATPAPAAAGGDSFASPTQMGLTLYQTQHYAASADNFELAIRSAAPEPRLYYYAALANSAAGRAARAKQLYDYITTNFPTSAEAKSAQAALAPAKSVPAQPAVTAATSTAAAKAEAPHIKGALAFSTQEIAREGAHAIDQSAYPNCWFEASMSALAMLPRGQRMLSNMIHYGDGDKYVVRFPGDGVEYVVSKQDAADAGITNKALWATLLECAQIRKFPNNQGAEGAYSDQSRLEVGMGCITGGKAEQLFMANASQAELASFIGGAVRSQNPIIAGTWDNRTFSNQVPLVIGAHAYTIIDIDPARNMVTIRNPHGAGSRRFALPGDPQHLKFEQMDDGVFKMNLELMPIYFHSLARSFI